MNEQNPEFCRWLSDHHWDRLRIICGPCGRKGSYLKRTSPLRDSLNGVRSGRHKRSLRVRPKVVG